MFEYYYASRPTPESAVLLDRVREAGRAESQAAAERLVAVGELFVLRCRDSGEQQHWAADAWEAVAAQVAAALRCSVAMGSSYLRYAMAMRDRLPQPPPAARCCSPACVCPPATCPPSRRQPTSAAGSARR